MCWLIRRWLSSICCLTFFCSFSSQRIKMFGRWLFLGRSSRQKKFMRGFGLRWCWQLFIANLETQFTQQGEDLLLVVFLETGWPRVRICSRKRSFPTQIASAATTELRTTCMSSLVVSELKDLWQTLLLQLCGVGCPCYPYCKFTSYYAFPRDIQVEVLATIFWRTWECRNNYVFRTSLET